MAEKPAVLIIGGLGYVGRFLALHIHKNNLASEVRIVDKVLPQLAWLAPEFAEACSQDKFMQADASKERTFCGFPYHLRRFLAFLMHANWDYLLTFLQQNPSHGYSIDRMANSGTMYSIAAEKPNIHRKTRYTRCGHWH